VDCYFISFFPKSYVTDTVLLDLRLASNYRLKSANLERYVNNEFVTIHTIEPVENLQMTVSDIKPLINRNLYRVRLERDDYKSIYSDEVEVFFNPVQNLFVFPNPIYTYQELNVINGDELPAEMKIYDQNGKFLYAYSSGPASIKVFPLKNISGGIYLLEVISESGLIKTKRIMVVKKE
jgi:hypothetical protein